MACWPQRPMAADAAAPGEHGLGSVEDHAQSRARRRRRLRRRGAARAARACVQQCLTGRLGGGGEDVASPRPLVTGTSYGGERGGPRDGQDRALDRRTDRGVAGVGRLGHRLGHHHGVAFTGYGAGDPRDQCPEELAEDDAAVAPGAEQGPAAERRQRRPDPGTPRVEEGVAGGAHREVHVGAGVAVRHREDVEGVDLLAGLGQGVDGLVDEAPDDRELEAAAGGCFHGLALLLGLAGTAGC